MDCPNTLLAESTSDSTVLDNLSINGLLAQYVQKAGRLPFGYPTGLLAKIAHAFLSVAVLTFKIQYQGKNKHGQQSVSAIRAQFFMRIRYRFHTVYRIIFLTISTPMLSPQYSYICLICFQYQCRYFCCLH